MSEQPFVGADEVEAHLRAPHVGEPVSDSRWTTGEDVDAHFRAPGSENEVVSPQAGRTYPADGDGDVEGHIRYV